MRHIVILLACLAVLCAQPAEAVTISLNPVSDGKSYSTDGGSTWFSPETTGFLEVSLSDPSVPFLEIRSALEFDIGSLIPSGSTIQSATLVLYKGEFANANVGVYGYAGDGEVKAADFFNSVQTASMTPPQDVNEIDVTSFIANLFNTGEGYAGFELRELLTGHNCGFWSSEASGEWADLKPRLDIVYSPVPEPSTMLLLGSGLVGLVGYGRRRFKK